MTTLVTDAGSLQAMAGVAIPVVHVEIWQMDDPLHSIALEWNRNPFPNKTDYRRQAQ